MNKIFGKFVIVFVIIMAFVAGTFVGNIIIPKLTRNEDYEQLEELVSELNNDFSSYDELENQKEKMEDDKGIEYYTKTYTSDELEYYIEDAEFFGRSTDEYYLYSNCVYTERGEDYYAKCTKEEYDNYQKLKEDIEEASNNHSDMRHNVNKEIGKYNATHDDKYKIESSGGYCYLVSIDITD